MSGIGQDVSSVGGYGGLGIGGGFGGGGLIEGLILASLLGRRGGGLFGGDGESASLQADGIAAKTALLIDQNADQNALLGAIASLKDVNVGEFRGIGAGICGLNAAIKDGNYAAAIQAERNTNELSTQATAFAVAASREAGTNTAAILATIAANKEQDLRDKIIALELRQVEERRRHDDEKIQIINTNNNVNTLTAIQSVKEDSDRKFAAFFGVIGNQLNRTGQDINNFGTMTASGTQAASSINTK